MDLASTLAFFGGGNMGSIGFISSNRFAPPLLQSDRDVYALMYTAPRTVAPHVQYPHVSANPALGILSSADSWGGALLANYNADTNWNIAGRVEYMDTSRGDNLLYGVGSKAWSITLTPTYRSKVLFARAESFLCHGRAYDAVRLSV